MASKENKTYVHTCDLCGEERPHKELARLVRMHVPEFGTSIFDSGAPAVDVCTDCQKRTVAEVNAWLNDRPKRDRFGNRA